MWLIAGLGNPGSKYRFNRHNVGFMIIDSYLASIGGPPEKTEHKALTYKISIDDIKVILAKPQTYMNNSGESVLALSQFYKIETKNILVIHDEVDIPFGHVKLQFDRGHGGQNGIRDIHEKLGSTQYYRMKIGVGRPAGKMDVAAHVLANFSKEEVEQLPKIFEKANDAIETLIIDGYNKAATDFNGNLL